MGFTTKIQLIQRKNSEQWYIFFPMAIARAMNFDKGEEVEMNIESKNEILLKRIRNKTPAKTSKTKTAQT